MSFIRTAPIPVVQSDTWLCWAACMEMINRAHPGKFTGPVRNQAEWVAAMQAAPCASVALNEHNGINMSYFGQFTNVLHMQFFGWLGPPSDIPDLAFAETKLHHSLLLAAYRVSGGCHFIVINGFTGTSVLYTNPAPGTGQMQATYEQFRSRRLIIAWKP